MEQKYNGRLCFSLVHRKCVAVEGRPTISKAGMLITELKGSRKTWRKHTCFGIMHALGLKVPDCNIRS